MSRLVTKYIKFAVVIFLVMFILFEVDEDLFRRVFGVRTRALEPGFITASKEIVKSNLMFIKTHKTGSSTLGGMFYLYGIRKKKNFVLFPYTNKLDEVSTRDIVKLIPTRRNLPYNWQVQHAVFNPDFEHIVLPKNRTFYTTIVRSAIANFKSSFVFFGHEEKLRREYPDMEKYPFDELADMYLDSVCPEYKPSDRIQLGDGCLLINSAAYDLGWKQFTATLPHLTIQERIDAFIAMLDSEFDLVMITDRFDESLVMLKLFMHWQMDDIMFLSQKTSVKKPKTDLSTRTERKILRRMTLDDQIFNHFNLKLSRQVAEVGVEHVSNSVATFRNMRQEFEDRCYDKSKGMVKYCEECSDPKMEHVVGWELSDYGKNEDPACAFLNAEFSNYCGAVSDLQLSHDYTDLHYQYLTSPEAVAIRKLIEKIKWG